MRVMLVHNPGAGGDKRPDRKALLAMIRSAGHTVRYCSSHDRRLAAALKRPVDLVAIAGGDGTVAKVVKLAHGRGVALAVLPTGTANNIATTLGLTNVPLEREPSRWTTAQRIRIDIGRAAGPWGRARFVEAFGLGVLPLVIRKAKAAAASASRGAAGDAVSSAVSAVRSALRNCTPVPVQATLDGRDISGRYLLLEAMNMSFVGPNLNLAARADPGDGRLDIVLVTERERELLDQYLAAEERGDSGAPALPARRGRNLQIEWSGFAVHIDDRPWPTRRRRSRESAIEISLYGEDVEFLVPA
jgi:diacylglycerol kinase family enzyme